MANPTSFSAGIFTSHDDTFDPTVGIFSLESRAKICPQ
jgi:hypothetical protein